MPSLERRRLQCYLIVLVSDIAALFAGFLLSGALYLGSDGIAKSLVLAQLLLPVFLTIALYNSTYSIDSLLRPWNSLLRVHIALLVSSAGVVFIAFYTKSSEEFSRVNFTLGVMLTAFLLFVVRAQMRDVVRWRCGAHVINQLIIDDQGPVVDIGGATLVTAAAHDLSPELGDPHALDRIGLLLRNRDRVVVSCPPERRLAWSMILKGANVIGEVVDDTVSSLGAQGARIAGGLGWLLVSVGPLGIRARILKRGFDLVLASTALVLLSPLLVLVAAAIVIEDGTPVLFIQQRMGLGNRFFAMFKFRSMTHGQSDPQGHQSTARGDQRITRVGRFIRRTSIDELPQLFNVIVGNMSLVGPRPHAIGSQAGDKLFWEIDARYWQRHALKPGVTGLAQIRGLRGATEHESDLAGRLNADLEYLNGWSIWRDAAIILATARVLVHDRAY